MNRGPAGSGCSGEGWFALTGDAAPTGRNLDAENSSLEMSALRDVIILQEMTIVTGLVLVF